jgi:hypothetical protein
VKITFDWWLDESKEHWRGPVAWMSPKKHWNESDSSKEHWNEPVAWMGPKEYWDEPVAWIVQRSTGMDRWLG